MVKTHSQNQKIVQSFPQPTNTSEYKTNYLKMCNKQKPGIQRRRTVLVQRPETQDFLRRGLKVATRFI